VVSAERSPDSHVPGMTSLAARQAWTLEPGASSSLYLDSRHTLHANSNSGTGNVFEGTGDVRARPGGGAQFCVAHALGPPAPMLTTRCHHCCRLHAALISTGCERCALRHAPPSRAGAVPLQHRLHQAPRRTNAAHHDGHGPVTRRRSLRPRDAGGAARACAAMGRGAGDPFRVSGTPRGRCRPANPNAAVRTLLQTPTPRSALFFRPPRRGPHSSSDTLAPGARGPGAASHPIRHGKGGGPSRSRLRLLAAGGGRPGLPSVKRW